MVKSRIGELETERAALTDYITSAKKPGIYYIDCSYQLVYLVLTGIILTVWQNHT